MPDCDLQAAIQPLAGSVVRITDRQGYQASERWTDSLQSQVLLEALIERVKPPAPPGQHRLLTTPFRYPPLRSGSRFTAADQRELFYGARGLGTVHRCRQGRSSNASKRRFRWRSQWSGACSCTIASPPPNWRP